MKFFASLVLLVCAVGTIAKPFELKPGAIPQKCSDVLAQSVCTELNEIAKTFKLNVAIINKVVVDAAIQGYKSRDQIYKTVVEIIRKDVLSKTCEDVLSPTVCTQLREASANLKVKASEVDKFVREAVLTGKTRANEIIETVRDYLKNEVFSKTCEDFLTDQVCTNLRKSATNLKVKAKLVDKAVKEALSKGLSKSTEIFNFSIEYLKNINCGDFLSQSVCAELKETAKTFKLTVDVVNRFVVDAAVQGYQSREEIYLGVVDLIRKEVLSKKCEDVLSTKVCAQLRDISRTLKVKVSQVDKFVKEAVLKGKTRANEIIEDVREYVKNEVLTKTCEDFLTNEVCSSLKKLATKLKVKAKIVDKAVKEALSRGGSITDIFKYSVEYLQNNIKCDDFLKKRSCTQLKEIAKTFKLNVAVVHRFVFDAVIHGYNRRDQIYSKVVSLIRKDVITKTCEDVLSATRRACFQLREVATNLKVQVGDVDKFVKEAVLKGKVRAAEIIESARNYLKNEVLTKTCEDLLTAEACTNLKTVAAQLKVEAKQVDKAVKEALSKGVSKATEIFNFCIDQMKEKIQCEDFLSLTSCRQIKRYSKTIGVFPAVEKFMQETISKGMNTATELYPEVISFIKSKIYVFGA